MEYESGSYTNYSWGVWYSPKDDKETRLLGNKRMWGDYPIYSIFEISQNTEKSPEDLKRIAVTKTQMETIS